MQLESDHKSVLLNHRNQIGEIAKRHTVELQKMAEKHRIIDEAYNLDLTKRKQHWDTQYNQMLKRLQD